MEIAFNGFAVMMNQYLSERKIMKKWMDFMRRDTWDWKITKGIQANDPYGKKEGKRGK